MLFFIENEFSNPCDGNDEPDELFPDKWFQSNMFNLHDDYLPDKEKTIDPLNDAVVDVRNDDSETESLVLVNLEVAHEVRNEVFNNDEVPENEIRIQDRPQRNRTIPDRYGWGYANMVIAEEPQNINEALNCQYADQWKEAAQNEFNSLIANGTWDLVDLPENKKLIGSKWVFKIKHDSNGQVDRFKARLVAQGFSQKHGIDYNDVFAPVARYTPIRSILAIANQLDLEVHQMDVKSAFLNGKLNEEIYMHQPGGFVNAEKPRKVCRLKKGLYGLKQFARCWNIVLDKHLKNSGYSQSPADLCVYTRTFKQNDMDIIILVAVYVDDKIIASNNIDILNSEKSKLSTRFDMDDRGELHHLQGMRIRRDRKAKVLMLDQSIYLKKVLHRFGFENSRPVATPMDPCKKFDKLADDEDPVEINEYQAVIGCLTYASICTHPYITTAVSYLSQFMSRPGTEHWEGVKRVLRYIRGTLDLGLKFKSVKNLCLFGYSDADWAGDVSSRKSRSGDVFMLGGAIVSWMSKKQPVVALSSTESEYIALSYAAQETIWLRRLVESLTVKQDAASVFEDNQGAIALCKNPKDHGRTKHIDIRYHFVRNTVENKLVELRYCSTDQMIADAITKPLPRVKFEHFRSLIGVEKW